MEREASMFKISDVVILASFPSFGWEGKIDAVFPAGTTACDGEPWAWVKWANGGEGACKLTDLQKVGA
jgi:hypothetical protein